MTTALVTVPAITYRREAYIDKWGYEHPTKTIKRRSYKKKIKSKKRKKTVKGRGYSPKVKSGWKKTQPAKTRRTLVLKAHSGDLLSSARSKQALANVTQDEETKELALADAQYFFKEYSKSK